MISRKRTVKKCVALLSYCYLSNIIQGQGASPSASYSTLELCSLTIPHRVGQSEYLVYTLDYHEITHSLQNPDDPQAAQKFQEMAAAYVLCTHDMWHFLPIDRFNSYEILSVSESRESYDRFGLDGIKGAADGPGMDEAADIFAELFGGMHFGFDFGGPGGGPRRSKGEDSVITYDVTLEDLYNGKSVKMNMEKEAVCSICKGCVDQFLRRTSGS